MQLEGGGSLVGYAQGGLAWAAGDATFIFPDGSRVWCRVTMVLREEDGTWRIVHMHAPWGCPMKRYSGCRLGGLPRRRRANPAVRLRPGSPRTLVGGDVRSMVLACPAGSWGWPTHGAGVDWRAVAQLAESRSPKPVVGGSSPSCPARGGTKAVRFQPKVRAIRTAIETGEAGEGHTRLNRDARARPVAFAEEGAVRQARPLLPAGCR